MSRGVSLDGYIVGPDGDFAWTAPDEDVFRSELEWAALWKPLPKVVFSSMPSTVQGNARLALRGLAEDIEQLRAESGEGDIAIGGATLAAEGAGLGLIDDIGRGSTRCWLAVAFRSFPSASPARISNSSRRVPSPCANA